MKISQIDNLNMALEKKFGISNASTSMRRKQYSKMGVNINLYFKTI